jgi:hypothetical protein
MRSLDSALLTKDADGCVRCSTSHSGPLPFTVHFEAQAPQEAKCSCKACIRDSGNLLCRSARKMQPQIRQHAGLCNQDC